MSLQQTLISPRLGRAPTKSLNDQGTLYLVGGMVLLALRTAAIPFPAIAVIGVTLLMARVVFASAVGRFIKTLGGQRAPRRHLSPMADLRRVVAGFLWPQWLISGALSRGRITALLLDQSSRASSALRNRGMLQLPPPSGSGGLQEHKRSSQSQQPAPRALAPLAQTAVCAGLDSKELFMNTGFSSRHESLLLSYVFNLKGDPSVVREMIVSDIRSAIDLGASRRAADLLLVLRAFLAEHAEAGINRHSLPGARRRNYLCLAGRSIGRQ